MRTIACLISIAVIVLAGCARQPTESRLIGKWEVVDNGHKVDIVYRNDHTFEASGHTNINTVFIASGTWHLEHDCIVQDVKKHAEKYAEGTQRRWNIVKLTRNTLMIDEWKKYQYNFKRVRPWWQII